ncbi:MAG: LIC12162 family protein [Bacteriovorax sp.]|nr:LIC12162 family protein [Bacteriovorax sp.]
MSYFLITTADEKTWKLDRPVLFLGEWCKLYDRKNLWESMDAITAEPFGLEQSQKEQDFSYILNLVNQLIEETTVTLNNYHQTNHSVRYWNIVLGYWIHRYVNILFNRYFTLENALKKYDISSTTLYNIHEYSLASKDSLEFIWSANDDFWNHVLYADILNYLKNGEIEIEKIVHVEKKKQSNNQSAKFSFKTSVINVLSRFLPFFSRKGDAFIINSYLPKSLEIKLQLLLGQVPQLWKSPLVKQADVDPEVRKKIILDESRYSGFEFFIRTQMIKMMPSCYIEGYKNLVAQASVLPWPMQPKFIFTSNNFDTDEIFKIWTASKIENGIPYFTGQHGNNYGTHFYAGTSKWPDRSASDQFFSWGWKDSNLNVVPAFCLKNPKLKLSKFDPNGGLLLIENCNPLRVTPWDNYYEFGIFLKEQFLFVGALPQLIQQQLIVRFHGEHEKFKWADKTRWQEQFSSVRIEAGSSKISELIKQSRLVVHSYDSTGILETLSLNIPTICFWQGGLDHLLPDAKPYYQTLIDAEILAENPKQAALIIASHWDNIGEWWNSKKVQEARIRFCSKYAKNEKHPANKMKQLLTSYAKDKVH